MKHHRQSMRDKIIEILKGAHIPGVFEQIGSRQFFQLPAVPYIAVADAGELVHRDAGAYQREVSFAIQIAVKVEDGADDIVDTIAAYVEANLDLKLHALAQDGRLSDVQVDASGEGDQQLLVKTMVYVFKYATELYNPTAANH